MTGKSGGSTSFNEAPAISPGKSAKTAVNGTMVVTLQ